jgi:hypothetical protein
VADGFDRLRHDLIVCRHDQHHEVGHLRPARPHRRKGLMARRVNEGQVTAIWQVNVVRTDMLRDPARFAGHDIGLPDIVQQRGFPVVDVTHNRDNGWTRQEVFLLIGRCSVYLGGVFVFPHRFEPEFGCDQLDLIEVEPLIHRHHEPELFESKLHDLGGRDLHDVSEFGYGDKFVDPNPGLLLLPLRRHATFLDLPE